MALHSGVSGAGPICKPALTTTTTTTTTATATTAAAPPLRRRRRRASLVRCRAYVWSKDDLARLDALSRLPRDDLLREHPPDERLATSTTTDLSLLLARHFHHPAAQSPRNRRAPAPRATVGERRQRKRQPHQTLPQQQHQLFAPPAPVQPISPLCAPAEPEQHASPPRDPSGRAHAVTAIAATLIDLSL